MTRKSKAYESGEYDDIFTASATDSLTNEEAVAYSQSYYRLKEQESAIRFAEKKAEARGIEEGMERGIAQGLERGIAQGMERGIAQGILEGILTTARNLKSLGFSVNDIKKATGLSDSAIATL